MTAEINGRRSQTAATERCALSIRCWTFAVRHWTFDPIDKALSHHWRKSRHRRALAEKLAGAKHTLLLHGCDREALAKMCGLVEAKSGAATPGAENGEWPEHREHFVRGGKNKISRLEQSVAYALSRPAEVAVENMDLQNLTDRL